MPLRGIVGYKCDGSTGDSESSDDLSSGRSHKAVTKRRNVRPGALEESKSKAGRKRSVHQRKSISFKDDSSVGSSEPSDNSSCDDFDEAVRKRRKVCLGGSKEGNSKAGRNRSLREQKSVNYEQFFFSDDSESEAGDSESANDLSSDDSESINDLSSDDSYEAVRTRRKVRPGPRKESEGELGRKRSKLCPPQNKTDKRKERTKPADKESNSQSQKSTVSSSTQTTHVKTECDLTSDVELGGSSQFQQFPISTPVPSVPLKIECDMASDAKYDLYGGQCLHKAPSSNPTPEVEGHIVRSAALDRHQGTCEEASVISHSQQASSSTPTQTVVNCDTASQAKDDLDDGPSAGKIIPSTPTSEVKDLSTHSGGIERRNENPLLPTRQKCGQAFTRFAVLDKHESTCGGKAHGRMPKSLAEWDNMWEKSRPCCPFCSLKFAKKANWKRHYRSRYYTEQSKIIEDENLSFDFSSVFSAAIKADGKKRGIKLTRLPKDLGEWKELWERCKALCPFCSKKSSAAKGFRVHILEQHQLARLLEDHATSNLIPKTFRVHILEPHQIARLMEQQKKNERMKEIETPGTEESYQSRLMGNTENKQVRQDWERVGDMRSEETDNLEDIAAAFHEGARLMTVKGEHSPSAKKHWQMLWGVFRPCCPLCKDKSMRKEREWVAHVLQNHTDHEIKCPHCPVVYKRPSSLKHHVQLYHGDSKETPVVLACPSCEVVITGCATRKLAEVRLKSHMKEHLRHSGQFNVICSACAKGFMTEGELKQHASVHTTTRAFKCETCPKTYKARSGLLHHIETVHRKVKQPVVVCHICGKRALKKQFNQHLQVHRKDKSFKCPECGAAFRTQISLHQHKVFHTGKRRFLCEICSSSFFLRHHLKAHMKSHSDVKPFHCKICDMDFRLKHHLQDHGVRRHGAKSEATVRGPKAKVIDGLRSKPPIITVAASSLSEGHEGKEAKGQGEVLRQGQVVQEKT